ncbi:hypothetical protein IFM89_000267 [Coptis chinensis]|uniref:Uncharacterized protein n=1 Tax=Coptis chinensis TaxID=261450 RepID=A0A835GWR2_9MAGN|nr:hypothetical protein IFM89_000267 [Coptis chinensis]
MPSKRWFYLGIPYWRISFGYITFQSFGEVFGKRSYVVFIYLPTTSTLETFSLFTQMIYEASLSFREGIEITAGSHSRGRTKLTKKERHSWAIAREAVVPIKILSPTKKGIVLLHGGKGQGYYDLEKKEFKQILIDGIAMGSFEGQDCPHLISPRSLLKYGCVILMFST